MNTAWVASVMLALALGQPQLASALPATPVRPATVDASTVGRIIRIFAHRGWEIDEDTAQLRRRYHGHDLDIQDSEPFAPLGSPDEVFRIVTEKEKLARQGGVDTHLVRLP